MESVSREVLKIIPLVQQTVIEYNTGFGDPYTMDKTDLKYYFEESARILMQKITPFLYYSQITLPYTWQDTNCYWDGDDIGCLRPVLNGGIPSTAAYACGDQTCGDPSGDERYPLSFPMNVSEAAKTVFTSNLTDWYIEQRIASLTRKDANGSWSSPYYYWDPPSNTSFALQTLSIPLEFNAAGTCVKATSVDVSLVNVAPC